MKMINNSQRFGEGSSIRVGASVYIYPGVFEAENSEELMIQRIDFVEDNIQEMTIIGNHKEVFVTPILFHTTADYCNYFL